MRQLCRETADNYLYAHSVNVALLTQLAASALEPAEPPSELALMGLLHDVGMTGAAEELSQQPRALTPDEWQTIRRHPLRNAELVRALDVPASVKQAVEQCHERAGGQGYPSGLDLSQIHDGARLLGCCDTYEAMTHTRSFRLALTPTAAMMRFVKEGPGLFDPHILKCLVQELSMYPVGSVVKLNTGDVGEVTAVNRGSPLRPILTLTQDAAGAPLAERLRLNLLEHAALFIREALDVAP